jgi:iron complex outermembrane recepter protein
MVRRLIAALLPLVGVLPLTAQQTTPARSDTLTRLKTFEVRASTIGRGAARAAASVPRAELQSTPSGTSALKVIERLPGVNMQSADPWGTYEWSNRVTIRGFQTQQIGQTFDGITLGDMSYGNFNGLGIGRAVDPDNLDNATVAQGTGALGTSSSNNLGGVIQYTSADPDNTAGWRLNQMAGAAASRRTFVGGQTGLRQLGSAGRAVKGFLTYSRIDNDKWKGGGQRFSPSADVLLGQRGFLFGTGETWQDHLNAKLVGYAGGNIFTAYYSLADRKEADYVDLSLRRFRAEGRDADQFLTWPQAQRGATGTLTDEAYFQSAQGSRRDHLGYLKGDFKLSEGVRLEVQPYVHTNRGAGDWHAPSYGATWSPDPIYFRQTQYENARFGLNSRMRAAFGSNQLEAGVWVERNESNIRRVGWRLQNYSSGPTVDFNNVLRLFFDRTGTLTNTMAYVQNTTTLAKERVRLTYGAKVMRIGADFVNNGRTIANAATLPDSARPGFSFPTDAEILPQFGAVVKATEHEELFATFSTNINAFPYSPQGGVYNTAPGANTVNWQFFRDNVKPERAATLEGGVRTRRGTVEAGLTGYTIDYRNRLIGVAVCPLTATCAGSFNNVGSVSTYGVEGLFAWTPIPGLTWFNSASYNRSTIDADYRTNPNDATTLVRASGKDAVDAPRRLANSRVTYSRKGFSLNAGGRFLDRRHFTIENVDSLAIPSVTVFDAGAGYRWQNLGRLRELSLQLNVTNLTDASFISTIGSGGFTLRDDTQTLLSAPRRLVFVTVGTKW